MVASNEELNGWPTDLHEISFDAPDLPDEASPIQLARSYATVTLRLAAIVPKFVRALEFLYGAIIGAKGQLASAARLEGRVEALEKLASLPPMRSETPSYLDVRDQASSKISGEFKRLARSTPGPMVPPQTPEQLTATVMPLVEELLLRREQELRVRGELERLAVFDAKEKEKADAEKKLREEADKARRKFKRQITYGAIVAFVAALMAGAGAATWARTQALAEGHQKGVEEGKKAASQSDRRTP